jgi:hypothetical protein
MTVNILTEDGTTVNVLQSATPNVVEVVTAGPMGPPGPPGTGSIVNTGSLLTTASFNSYTGSSTSQFAGTASYAVSSSYSNNSTSASYAQSSSRAISSSYTLTASYAQNAATASNILGGKATHIPFFITDTTLATSSLYQSGSSTIIINQDNATSANPEALYVWQPSTTSFNVISGKGNLNNYLQLNIHNTNQGTAASSDVVATADNGDETVNYIDMGINSENFSGDIGGANDAYLYSTGRHLHIGNVSNYPVQFFAGGLNSDTNRKLELRPDNNHNITGSLEISGSLKVNQGITGSLFGTSSYASQALSASWAPPQISSSYSNNSTSASYAILSSNALTASYITPLVQNVSITGSVNISGSTTQIGTNNLLGQTNLSGSIIVSGTMQANANVTIGGTLRLDAAQDPGSINATASFLFTSASNTAQGYDLYYRQNNNLAKFKWLEGGISTGLLYGGVVSASGTTIYVSSGSGLIMTANASLSQEISPIFKYITWNNYSASATYLTSSQNTFVYVDDTGIVRQQPSYFTETQYQEAICLGRATHANYTTITGVGSNVQTTYDSDAQQNDFIRAFGPLKTSGLTITGQTNTLRVNIGAGQSYNLGGFYPQNPDHPSDYTSNAFVTASIARAYRSGSGIYLDNNAGAFYTTVDPTKYDDGSGVLQNTGTGNWTIQRVFVNPVSGRVVVYYCQTRYTTQINALQYLATDPFTEGEFTAKSLIFAGYLVLKGNTTDLTDTENTIIQSGIFRNTAGGSASSGTISLALDNLSDVTITTPTDGQALVYNSGVFINGIPLNATSASIAVSSSYALTASYAMNGGGGGGAAFPYTGSAIITGSLQVTGSLNVSQGITGSLFGTASYAVSGGNQNLQSVTANGATTTNSITVDSLSGGQSSFSTNISDNANGVSIVCNNFATGAPFILYNSDTNQTLSSIDINGNINANSFIKTGGLATEYLMADGSVTSGSSGAAFPYTGNAQITGSLLVTSTLQLDGSLTDYASVTSTIVGSNNLYTQATGSYTSVFVKYTVSKGANSRAGEFITNWNGTSVTYFDNSTTDIGSTSDIVFSSAIVSSQIQVNATAASSGWKLKTLATFI